MRVIAVANQKGGVGKTTTAIHLAHALALAGVRTALLDLDPQGNATLALQGMQLDAAAFEAPVLEHLRPVAQSLWLLPSSGNARMARESRPNLQALQALAGVMDEAEFGFLVIDCPPRMDAWAWTGIGLADEVLVPVQAEFLALQGLSQMMQTLADAQREFPGRSALLGVLATMVDLREGVAREILSDLRNNLGTQVLRSVILRDPLFIEAASHGKTLFEYEFSSKGARSYLELAREVIHGRAKVG